jgi:hypothetical protein
MSLFEHKRALRNTAILTLAVFFSVFFLHAFIPHEHPHESVSANLLPALHVNTSDKFALIIGALVAVTFLFLPRALPELARARLYVLRGEWLLVIPRLYISLAFARGILHPKVY